MIGIPNRRGGGGTVIATAAVLAGGLLAGCGASSGGGGGTVRIAFTGYSGTNSFTLEGLKAVQKVAAADGHASVRFLDPQDSADSQLRQVETAMTAGRYDVLLVMPINGAGLSPAVRKAQAAGVKVVSIFTPLGPDLNTLKPQYHGVTSTVAEPVASSGAGLADMTVEACANLDPCRVAYLPGDPTHPLENVRTDAFMERIAGHPAIKVVSRQAAGYLPASGRKAGEDALRANPGLNVVVTNDQALTGVTQAVQQMKLTGRIKMIGLGGSIEAIANVRAGTWYGSYLNLPVSASAKAAEIGLAAARGKPYPRSVDTTTLAHVDSRFTQRVAKQSPSFAGEWRCCTG